APRELRFAPRAPDERVRLARRRGAGAGGGGAGGGGRQGELPALDRPGVLGRQIRHVEAPRSVRRFPDEARERLLRPPGADEADVVEADRRDRRDGGVVEGEIWRAGRAVDAEVVSGGAALVRQRQGGGVG